MSPASIELFGVLVFAAMVFGMFIFVVKIAITSLPVDLPSHAEVDEDDGQCCYDANWWKAECLLLTQEMSHLRQEIVALKDDLKKVGAQDVTK